MRAKVLNLGERDALVVVVLAAGGGLVVLREGAEGADLDLAGRDGAVRVDDDGEVRVQKSLLLLLRRDVDAR